MESPVIHLRGVSRVFGSQIALSEVNLALPAGRIGLLGPNGAGKSTLLKILMGLLAPSSGEGSVLDVPIGQNQDRVQARELRRRIGFMPEAEALIPGLTGVEYVAFAGELCGLPRRQALRRAHEVLTAVELEEARYRKVEQYSTGMKQRVKLAQALVHDPPLLLLDEPTSGLDPAGRDAFLRLIQSLGEEHGKSILLSTHLLADVEAVCEYVVILGGGRVRCQGPVAQLCAVRGDRYRLRVEGDRRRFRELLEKDGVRWLMDPADAVEEWRVRVPEGWSSVNFFQAAVAADAIVRSLVQDDETLEEFFLRTVGVT